MQRRNVILSPEEVFISSGVSDEFSDILDLFEPKSPALVIEPAYPVYADANNMKGRKVIHLYVDANITKGRKLPVYFK